MKQFKIQTSKQGYKYIPFTKQDCKDLFDSPGICDMCGEVKENGNYIFVLHNYECPDCFKDFENKIPYYQQDIWVENKNIEIFKQRHVNKATLV